MKEAYLGKIKLCADENIRFGMVQALRLQKVNIKHAKEVNMVNMSDQANFQYAKQAKRWLLTTDRHFLNNSLFPFEQIKGIVIVPDTGSDLIVGYIMAWLKYDLVPSGKGIDNCKIELTGEYATFHFRREGQILTQKIELLH